ncbi:PLP-dependent aminotransferase family protein [Streptomyces indicus]|uniref:GntR family transcriptional regulator / MocR family aminotransferase n=1 Tax=Streptomyces indicus TaxID=417292 RepID=A0A1G9EVC1_9ACTN|nr:PLP-dependent aminotransferase family protein [Streptomyces indicus]SDK80122.1 GntR family transcriptional regulator / MocR family aminotransferase [Streptomyces indicus]
MGDTWAEQAGRIGADLHLELGGGGSRRAALIRALRSAVREGRLRPGQKLPPYRSLAADLGLTRNTVASAYAELVAEGWLTARQGSGTRVASRTAPAAAPRAPAAVERRAVVHDLGQGKPDPSSFPRTAWAAAARRALTAAPNEAFGPGDPRGRPELRAALAEYLGRVRGVRTSPERIVVCSGFAHALRLLFGGAGGSGRGVLRGPLAVEAYGLGFHRSLLAAASVRTVPVEVDEQGARVGELASGVRAALLTPAHQFPTGGPLAPGRRAAVVDWARRRGGLVLEDDYDGEFRYDREPVGAVQGLDPERVVYLGSVSKSLSPAVRLGWIVLPGHLVDQVLSVKGEREAWASALDQLTLAEFLASGQYDRHVRRMRQRYRGRRDRLLDALAARAPHVGATGIAAGLHAVLRLPEGTEQAVLDRARRAGIALDGLSAFRHPEAAGPGPDGLVVGYAAAPEHAYGAAVDALCSVLRAPDVST